MNKQKPFIHTVYVYSSHLSTSEIQVIVLVSCIWIDNKEKQQSAPTESSHNWFEGQRHVTYNTSVLKWHNFMDWFQNKIATFLVEVKWCGLFSVHSCLKYYYCSEESDSVSVTGLSLEDYRIFIDNKNAEWTKAESDKKNINSDKQQHVFFLVSIFALAC